MEANNLAVETRLREEASDWLHANIPKGPTPGPEDFAGKRAYDLEWQRIQYEGGWAGVSWPRDYGGRGLSASEQLIWYEECVAAGAPSVASTCTWLGLNHAGPTLMHCGTEEQRALHLPRILKGETVWSQGFSEPNAGSDLASLRTRGEIDGDELVINGQKLWSTFAHLSDYQELLVRTGTPAERHRGLTWIIGDMNAPGIEIRPIRALDGSYHNCEVFYDDVRLPLANVVGEVGKGWTTAMSTLRFERGSAMFGLFCEVMGLLDALIEHARGHPLSFGEGAAIDDMSVAERLGRLRARALSIRSLIYMFNAADEEQLDLGAEGSILMLPFSELAQEILRYGLEVFGPVGLSRAKSWHWLKYYFSYFSSTIAGGSSEIQRNVIGERLLGLPR
jgi:alkylation response protein AidB-like acyl-CoA dehydrogenase